MAESFIPADRQDFYDEIAGAHLAPLWESFHELIPPSPLSPVKPHRWDYDNQIRARLMKAGELITAIEAERRVLVLENPGLAGKASATHALYAGVQLILPHEIAAAHRHSQSAMRFILEGDGGYTTVAGERIPMYPGDLVTTPNWSWHDHGNDTDTPLIWVDVLDLPLVTLLDTGFCEAMNTQTQNQARPIGDAQLRFGQNLFPVDWKAGGAASPINSYPYARTRETLSKLAANGEPDACHGYKVRYANPANGGHIMPTMGAFAQLLPKGFATAPYRCTDSAIYVVVEGEGETRVGDTVLRWKPRDIIVTPSWQWHTHRASSDAVLFSASDRPVQEALSLWREERRES